MALRTPSGACHKRRRTCFKPVHPQGTDKSKLLISCLTLSHHGFFTFIVLLGHIAVLRRCGLLLQSSMVCVSAGKSVTIANPAKTAVPIEMPFGMLNPVGPDYHNGTFLTHSVYTYCFCLALCYANESHI